MEDNPEASPSSTTELTDDELRTLAYFAVGVGSEGSVGGRDVSNRLSFAGRVSGGVMHPIGNSGYSIGTLQTDLGQHPEVATTLVVAYQDWARQAHPDWTLTADQQAQTASDLGRSGHTITAQHGRALDPVVKSHLDQFLASDAGITYVHERDVAQVDRLMRVAGAVDQLKDTSLYQQSTLDDQARLATMIMKLENQAGQGYYPRIIRGLNDGSIGSVDGVQTSINNLLPNRGGRSHSDPDYVETGVAHALGGTEVFNKLRNANEQSPLYQPWQDVVSDPLTNPALAGAAPGSADFGFEYATVKTLFLQKGEAPAFIDALNQGGTFGHASVDSRGHRRPQSTNLYAAGDDFVVLDGRGHGKAWVADVWRDVERSQLSRVDHPDGTTDLNLRVDGDSRRLLHLDPAAQPLRPVQTEAVRVHGAPPEQSERDVPANPAASGPAHPGHPDHALLEQIRSGVGREDARVGRTYDEASERLSRSLLAACKGGAEDIANGMSAIRRADHVVSGADNMFVVQGKLGDPAHLRVHVNIAEAMNTPVAQSDAMVQAVNQAQQQVMAKEQQLAPELTAASPRGPMLS